MGIDISDLQSLGLGGNESESTSVQVEEVSGLRSAPLEIDNTSVKLNDYEESVEQELKPFGYDLFKLGADAFQPATDMPVPADYVLGPGDTLIIQLYGKESATHTLMLNREGNVQFPEIGPISLAGLKFDQAVAKIEQVVSEQMIGIKSSITMGQLRTIRIFVLGEVEVPGSYVVGSLSTMTNAIFSSGGITEIGSLRKIQLKRQGKLVTELDLYDLLLNGDTSGDIRLLPGDVIFVPPVGFTASVSGAVKRPGRYELLNKTNAQTLIQLAGGLTASAYLPDSKIERLSERGEKTLVKLVFSSSSKPEIAIENADMLIIGDSLEQVTDTIQLAGHVKREGNKPWTPGMTFTDIVRDVDDLLALPDLELAIIEREDPASREISVITFSPKAALAAPKRTADISLLARDKIHLFGFEEERTELLTGLTERLKLQANFKTRQQIVRVDGSVRFPGEYPLAKDMTATDLVILAGGFTESALGRDGEITRYQINAARERVVIRSEVSFGKGEQVFLEAGDILRVKQIPLWTDNESVVLSGEFMHPGTYSLLPGETLLDVINRAGGLTPRAYPLGAVFSRAELRALEEQQLESLEEEVASDIAASRLESSDTVDEVTSEQAEEILENISRVEATGRLVIDLPAIYRSPEELDFQLVEGDRIEMPRYKPSVTVIGEVQYPTSHFYDKGTRIGEYLSKSGGLKRNADKNRIYVIKANGEVYQPKGNGWFSGKRSKLAPGDTIVVPLDTKRVDKLTLWASVTRIMYEAALGVAAINSL